MYQLQNSTKNSLSRQKEDDTRHIKSTTEIKGMWIHMFNIYIYIYFFSHWVCLLKIIFSRCVCVHFSPLNLSPSFVSSNLWAPLSLCEWALSVVSSAPSFGTVARLSGSSSLCQVINDAFPIYMQGFPQCSPCILHAFLQKLWLAGWLFPFVVSHFPLFFVLCSFLGALGENPFSCLFQL